MSKFMVGQEVVVGDRYHAVVVAVEPDLNGRIVLRHKEDGYWTALESDVLPLPKRHTLGGVVFEETGEVRMAVKSEWILLFGAPSAVTSHTMSAFPILRPVEVVK